MPNDLIHETSPYLLQHANNPVDWLPWNEKSLALAKQQNQPILLSIGYAACHWCHVMAHESFENKEIAEQMNRDFVCIKVDREERPDLDRIYQTAHQMLTKRPGGWPLTVALTPDLHAPFFAGTYFPPVPRQGMPGFGELLQKIATHYRDNAESMGDHGKAFARALERLNPVANNADTNSPTDWLVYAQKTLKSQFDSINGGFGDAPRFPHPTQLALLYRHGGTALEEHDVSLAMANKTMRKMRQGGLFDQVSGGFFRYSVDKAWQIPHFEKMLYDNAQLLDLYSSGFVQTGRSFYRTTALRTARWVVDEMQQGHGGYASSLDADSEGDEGKYYVWSETDLRAILAPAQYEAVEQRFSLYGDPNFEGTWHLNINPDLDEEEVECVDDELAAALAILKDTRSERVRPDLDDKVLTSWNGMMITAMTNAGRALDEPELVNSARSALDFVRANLWREGRLLATFREQQARLNGYLDDYVFMAEAILALLQQEWRPQEYLMLQSLCDALCEWFEDKDNGGFFFTSHDHETLLHRPKAGADDAIPSANGGAVRVLYQFGMLSGDPAYQESARRTVSLFASEIEKHPSVYASLLLGALDSGPDARTVIVRGTAVNLREWQQALRTTYLPGTSVFCVEDNTPDLPAGVADKAGKQGKTLAYICRGDRCDAPVDSLEGLLIALGVADS